MDATLLGSQDNLTKAISSAHGKLQGEPQEWARLMLSTVGRGGDGQKIRDEILNIMHRNKISERKVRSPQIHSNYKLQVAAIYCNSTYHDLTSLVCKDFTAHCATKCAISKKSCNDCMDAGRTYVHAVVALLQSFVAPL